MKENCSFIRNYHTTLFQCLQAITMYSSWKTKTYVPSCYLESHLYHLSRHCIASSSSHSCLARKLVSVGLQSGFSKSSFDHPSTDYSMQCIFTGKCNYCKTLPGTFLEKQALTCVLHFATKRNHPGVHSSSLRRNTE